MKMVKSLLLGSAAGIMAVAGAQAADLPVKAKPVEYVKVCSLYGAGFYYMPGTDICIKIGGFARAQVYWGGQTSPTNGPFYGNNGFMGREVNQTNDFAYRARSVLTVDTRQQTEYGTLRTYILFGFSHDGPGSATSLAGGTTAGIYVNRGFIQLAGFTFGKAQSFYDIYSNSATSYFGIPSPDTGDSGVNLVAYTAQFGNGFTGTISLEDPRRAPIVDGSFTAVGTPTSDPFLITGLQNNSANVRWPDVVGVLRVDQAWGSAQVAGVIHDASGGYYGSTLSQADIQGHPSDKIGWAVSGGAIINTDFISPGDKFSFQASYTEGALRYLDATWSGLAGPFQFKNNSSLGFAYFADGIYSGTLGTGTGVELTKAFGLNASYDHVWNQKWKTSLYGGFLDFRFSDTAKGIIAASTCITRTAPGSVSAMSNCDPNWSEWYIGSRTQFNINSSTYLGLDVMYRKLNTAFQGTATYTAATNTVRPTGTYNIEDQDAVSVTFRVHRDFLP